MPEVSVTKKRPSGNGGLSRLLGWDPMAEPNLFQMNPFTLLRRFTEDLEKAIGPTSPEIAQIAEWRPAIEIFEDKGKIVLKADLPGVKQEDLSVNVVDGMLTVEGERKHEVKTEKEGYYRSERAFGRFCRTVPLPEGAKTDQASAQFANGVLEVSVPVPELAKRRHAIPVQAPAATKATAQ